jgi:hypothetical protein
MSFLRRSLFTYLHRYQLCSKLCHLNNNNDDDMMIMMMMTVVVVVMRGTRLFPGVKAAGV